MLPHEALEEHGDGAGVEVEPRGEERADARGTGLPGVPNVREDPRERRLVLKESRRAYLRRNSTPAAASIAPTAIINCASGLHPAPKLVALYPVRP